jgi:hypothetical protein
LFVAHVASVLTRRVVRVAGLVTLLPWLTAGNTDEVRYVAVPRSRKLDAE